MLHANGSSCTTLAISRKKHNELQCDFTTSILQIKSLQLAYLESDSCNLLIEQYFGLSHSVCDRTEAKKDSN